MIRDADDEPAFSFDELTIPEGARAFLAFLLDITSKQVYTGY